MDEASDQARFTEVFVPYLVDAFRLARWLAGSRADAEDIVQEASMRAFKYIRGFSGGNPRAWVLTIVRNTSYSWLAKNRPKDMVLSDDLNQDDREQFEQAGTQEMQTPETALIAKLEAEQVRKLQKQSSTPAASCACSIRPMKPRVLTRCAVILCGRPSLQDQAREEVRFGISQTHEAR